MRFPSVPATSARMPNRRFLLGNYFRQLTRAYSTRPLMSCTKPS